MEAATFKWSRDNGSVIFPILRQQGSMATLQSLGHDTDTRLKIGDWVEIMDDGLELRGEPGILAQVESIDPFEMNVTLQLPDDVNVDDPKFSWPSYDEQSTNHPLLRRWDYHAIDGIAMSQGAILISENSETDEGWIEIEDGIEAQFQLSDGEKYRTGDYWLIPARVATGRIEWPTTDVDGNEVPIALAPHGIEHHYAPLGVIVDRQVQDKCRCRLPLTAIVCNDPGNGQG